MKKYEQFINEILMHPTFKELKDHETVISYRKYIYVLNDDSIKEIIKDFNIPDDYTEDYEIMDYLRESNPEVLIFSNVRKYEKEINFIISDSYYSIDPYISKQFIETLKTLKTVGIEWINIYEDSAYDEEGDQKTFHIDNLIDNFTKDIKIRKLPKYVYHGTSANRLEKILKIGLRNNKESNFKNIYYDNNYLFFTSYKNEAIFYAERAAQIKNSFPVILKIDTSCIDTARVDKDYDFYYDYIGRGNEYFDEIKANLGNYEVGEEKILQHLHDKYIGATYRKFSYDGHILPYYIDEIFYKTDPDSDFSNSFEQEDFKTFLEIIDYAEDVGYDYHDYFLDRDLIDYNENDEDENEED